MKAKNILVVAAVLVCLLMPSHPASTTDCIAQTNVFPDSGFGLVWGMWVCAVYGSGCTEEIFSNCGSCITYNNYSLCNKAPMVDDYR
jgi:hypothetical protein